MRSSVSAMRSKSDSWLGSRYAGGMAGELPVDAVGQRLDLVWFGDAVGSPGRLADHCAQPLEAGGRRGGAARVALGERVVQVRERRASRRRGRRRPPGSRSSS
jgi:hypothetical protein